MEYILLSCFFFLLSLFENQWALFTHRGQHTVFFISSTFCDAIYQLWSFLMKHRIQIRTQHHFAKRERRKKKNSKPSAEMHDMVWLSECDCISMRNFKQKLYGKKNVRAHQTQWISHWVSQSISQQFNSVFLSSTLQHIHFENFSFVKSSLIYLLYSISKNVDAYIFETNNFQIFV